MNICSISGGSFILDYICNWDNFLIKSFLSCLFVKNSEYDQEIPQSQTADKPWNCEEEPHNNHETPGRQTKQSNQLSLPHQDDCKTRMDIK